MTKEELREFFQEAKSNELAFEGSCLDCKEPVSVEMDSALDGKITISGGAVYFAGKPEKKLFVKCDKCFGQDPRVNNFQPCEVYSRVVGYLRPVKQWALKLKIGYFHKKGINYTGMEK